MDRREQMRSWLAFRAEHGLTFRELSERTGVPVGTLASWAWKLRRELEDASSPRSVSGASSFVELVPQSLRLESGVASCAGAGRIEIELVGGRRIVVSGAVDETALVCVVRALERC